MRTIERGDKVTGRWGQWYRHDRIMLDGKAIGIIQVRRRYYGRRIGHRIETITYGIHEKGCVVGSDPEWVIRQFADRATTAAQEGK